MLNWPFRKVKNFVNVVFISHSVLVLFSSIIGFTAYHSEALINAIPDSGFLF